MIATLSVEDQIETFTVAEFIRRVKAKSLTDAMGWGYPARNGKYDPDIIVLPSMTSAIPSAASHIAWWTT